MGQFIELYLEAGMIGIVGIMFVYMIISMTKRLTAQQEDLENIKVENKGQSETLENMEGMIIKLIDRWNKSDDIRDRRHEDLTKEINDMDNQLSEIKGSISRINGHIK
jgi:septal ring factor EnvC (AmiA/AmiB activator)